MTAIESIPPLAPDWESVEFDVLCPLCDYNLRGLESPRCPECGYAFEWAVLLDEDLHLHPYVFEHHAERNIWSFFRTVIAGLSPAKFWKTLRPQQPSSPKRLVIYWGVATTILLVALVAAYATLEPNANAVFNTLVHWSWGNGSMLTMAMLVSSLFRRSDAYFVLPLLLAVWPWFSLAALLVYQQSMGRRTLRRHHVLRCVVYAGDVMIWAAAALLAHVLFVLLTAPSRQGNVEDAVGLALVTLVFYLLGCYRLVRAYRDYLQFDHAVLTVAASQIIVVLAAIALMMYGPPW